MDVGPDPLLAFMGPDSVTPSPPPRIPAPLISLNMTFCRRGTTLQIKIHRCGWMALHPDRVFWLVTITLAHSFLHDRQLTNYYWKSVLQEQVLLRILIQLLCFLEAALSTHENSCFEAELKVGRYGIVTAKV